MIKLIKRLFERKEIRFLFVGGINTALSYSVYAFFIFIGVDCLIANTLSTIIGVINSYFWNRNFTFKSKASKKKEIPKFLSVYAISYITSMLFIFILVKKISMNEYIAGLLNLILTTLISWFGHNKISFKEDKTL